MINIVKSSKGVTLMETMISIAIFAFVLAAILNVSVGSMTMGKRSEYAYTAYNLAKNHLETLRSMPYSTLANAAETDTYLDANGVSDPDGPYIRTTTVTSNYTGDANLTQVTVQVSYTFRGQTTAYPTQLSTVMYQYG